MIDPNLIPGSEMLVTAFGAWPSFHDWEIVSVDLQRDEGAELTSPYLTIEFFGFRLEVPEEHPGRAESLITMRFRAIENLKLLSFGYQNCINKLEISTHHSERLRGQVFGVRLVPVAQFECSFECGQIEVVSVEPFRKSRRRGTGPTQ